MEPIVPSKKSRNNLVWLFPVAVVCGAAAVVFANPTLFNLPGGTPVGKSPAPSSAPVASNVLPSLLQSGTVNAPHSGSNGGLSVAYVKQSAQAKANPGVAYAAEAATYSTVAFTTESISGVTQVVSYDLTTKARTQWTQDPVRADSPVFSSSGQQLAYASYPDWDANVPHPGGVNDNCKVIVEDTAKQNVAILAVADECLTPISWSPDGRWLLINHDHRGQAGVVIDKSNVKILVTLALYDSRTRTMRELPNPSDSLMPESGGSWADTGSFLMEYTLPKYTQFLFGIDESEIKERAATSHTYLVTAADGTRIAADYLNAGAEIVNGRAYSLEDTSVSGAKPAIISQSLTDSKDIQKIPVGVFGYDWQLSRDASGAVSGLVYETGDKFGSDESSRIDKSGGIFVQDLSGNVSQHWQSISEHNDQISLLGWYRDYGTALYQTTEYDQSTQTSTYEIHGMNLSTGVDTLLVGGIVPGN